MAKICITGGAGFVGSHAVDRFIANGDEVHIIDDLSSGKKDNVNPKATLHVLDIRSAEAAAWLAKEKPDVIVHCAAQMSVRVSMEDPIKDTSINVMGLMNMLASMRDAWKPYFVMISTGGAIYGEQDYFPAKEDHPIRPESVYGLAKRVSEQYLDVWHRQFGLAYCALRLGNVYGPRQSPHGEAGVVAIFAEKMLKKETPKINGTGEQTRDFVYVGDVADGIFAASQAKVSGIYNIGTAKETSVNTLCAALAKAAAFTNSPEYGPGKGGEQMRSCIDWSAANKAFGYSPKMQLAEGVQATVDWFAGKRG